jgi:hypothetical protein
VLLALDLRQAGVRDLLSHEDDSAGDVDQVFDQERQHALHGAGWADRLHGCAHASELLRRVHQQRLRTLTGSRPAAA